MSINKNNIYNVIKVSELDTANKLQKLVFFGYDPTKAIEKQSVQIPYALIQNVFDGKQNKLKAGDLVELVNNADNTTTVNVQSDPSKQKKLVNTDGTIKLTDLSNGTTDIKAIASQGTDSIQTYSDSGTKVIDISSKIVRITSTAELMIIGISSNQNYITFINDSNIGVKFSFDSENSTNKLLKTDAIKNFVLPKNRVVRFLKNTDGWVLMKETAYFPDLADTSRGNDHNILINSDGTTKTEEIGVMHYVDLSVSSLTKAQLNTNYPNVAVNSTVTCDSIKYIKVDNIEHNWVSINLNIMHYVDLSVSSLTKAQLNTNYPNVAVNSTVTCDGIKYIKVDDIEHNWVSINLNNVI